MSKTITILGCSGSIGVQSLKVARNLGYTILGLTARSSVDIVEAQAREFSPRFVAMEDEKSASDLKIKLADTDITVLSGMEGICHIATMKCDTLINAIVGIAGLTPTLMAIAAGNDIALANKETLVAAGSIVMSSARDMGVSILPIDSEHSAMFQCLAGSSIARTTGEGGNKPSKLILTASGGPFFGYTKEMLEKVQLKDALKHPNWAMGSKITIDSATLMNKGLEFIEAMWLFHMAPKDIQVVVHPESIVHSAVEFADGSVIAQMGNPDMAIPIQYALTYPARTTCQVKPLSLTEIGKLTFAQADTEVFTCLATAITAAKLGGLYPCGVNSANEEAVKYFLQEKIAFTHIGKAVENIINMPYLGNNFYTLEDVLELDREVRIKTREFLGL